MLNGKVILITGGTGTFGQAFAEEALKYKPKEMRILSNDEYSLWLMQQNLNSLTYILGDVRDGGRVGEVSRGADIIIHAAALKHVPFCEENPEEAIKTNIRGSLNVIKAAKEYEIKKVINLGTDKGVKPINVYGATKFLADKLFLEAGYSVVRFGNFIGSRGSVLEKWAIEENPITITDPNMVRYWINPEDAARFMIECLEKMRGGEVFMPEMSPISIGDLAQLIAPDAEWKFIGKRKGEKLIEELC